MPPTLSIHHWPYEYLEDNREIIDRINKRLGYRLRMNEISYPWEVRIGEPFRIRLWGDLLLKILWLKTSIIGLHIIMFMTEEDFESSALNHGELFYNQ